MSENYDQPGRAGTNGAERPAELDDALLAELEAEFAALEAEVARINAMPVGWAQEQVDQLLALHQAWAERLRESGADKPAWRQRIEGLLVGSIERIIRENHTVDLQGRLNLRPDTVDLTREAGPIFQALLPALEEKLGSGLTKLLARATQGFTAPFEANVKVPLADILSTRDRRGTDGQGAPPLSDNVAPMHVMTTAGREVVVSVDLDANPDIAALLESLAGPAPPPEPAPSGPGPEAEQGTEQGTEQGAEEE